MYGQTSMPLRNERASDYSMTIVSYSERVAPKTGGRNASSRDNSLCRKGNGKKTSAKPGSGTTVVRRVLRTIENFIHERASADLGTFTGLKCNAIMQGTFQWWRVRISLPLRKILERFGGMASKIRGITA